MSGWPRGCPGVFGTPSQMSGSGRETLPDVIPALLDVREKLGGPFGCPGVGGTPPECPGVDARLSQVTGSGRESIPDVRGPSRMSRRGLEALPNVRQLSRGPLGCAGGPPGCPSGRENLPDVWESSEGPPGCLGEVWRPTRMSLRGGSPFWMSGSGQKAIPNVQLWFGGSPG